MINEYPILVYLLPAAFLIFFYVMRRYLQTRKALRVRNAALEAGLIEPASLHPVIDPAICLGCATCVGACPEGDILGLIHGKAVLVEPTHCIGHGACAKACPTEAITLVFGTATRGVDIPAVGPDFQTNVPGIYIAGELGGMGLIRNAITQGCQAMDHIKTKLLPDHSGMLDVIIVGAGPAGFAATLSAKQYGLRSLTLEQETLGGTVAHYPRGKLVMTKPVELPIIGKTRLKDPSKEKLLEFWQDVERRSGITIQYGERVLEIKTLSPGFEVVTDKGSYKTQAVLLAIGRRGTPRQLGVPGEDLNKVVYRLVDPQQYAHKRVLVVGGGDSALEAAAEIAEQLGTDVTLSYRSESFSRAKPRNRERIAHLEETGRLRVLMCSNVTEITNETVVITQKGQGLLLYNDAVIICVGGILPTAFLRNTGIEVETKFGTV